VSESLDLLRAIVETAPHRPYRAELGMEAALTEMQRSRGTLFDPAVVDACKRLFAEKGFKFSR
jgi:HD-GYP domain-containing protein (c-di-GMP phosphodiesterase class II)